MGKGGEDDVMADSPEEVQEPVRRVRKESPWWLIAVLMLAVIAFGTANRVMFKKMSVPMRNYAFFLNQATSFIYLPIFWPIVWIFMFTGKIDVEMRKFPTWKFAVMGLLDAAAGLLISFGNPNVTGSLQLLLAQLNIPATMVMSMIILRAKYWWNHLIGALIIMVGVGVSLIQTGGDDSSETTPVTGDGGDSCGADAATTSTITGILLYSLAAIPTGLSGVYKEIGFKDADLDVYYVNAWVASFQFGIGILFLPLTYLPAFGGIPFKEMPSSLWEGAECLFGHDTIGNTKSVPDGMCPDDCHGAFIMVAGYLFANVFYNVILLMMIKYGSAALFYVASAVILPLASICFSMDWIMGADYAEKLTLWDWLGLFTILGGLVIYRFLDLRKKRGATEELVDGDEEDEEGRPLIGDGRGGAGGRARPLSINAEESEYEEVEIVPIASLGAAGTEIARTVRRRVRSVRKPDIQHEPRSTSQVRNTYYSRLGFSQAPVTAVSYSINDDDGGSDSEV